MSVLPKEDAYARLRRKLKHSKKAVPSFLLKTYQIVMVSILLPPLADCSTVAENLMNSGILFQNYQIITRSYYIAMLFTIIVRTPAIKASSVSTTPETLSSSRIKTNSALKSFPIPLNIKISAPLSASSTCTASKKYATSTIRTNSATPASAEEWSKLPFSF